MLGGTWRSTVLGPAEGLPEAMTQRRAPTPLHSQGQKVDLCVPVCVGVQACACPRCSVVVCVCVWGVCTHMCFREPQYLGHSSGGSICGWWHSPDVHFQVCNELRAHGGSGGVKAGEGVQLDKALPTQDSRPGTGMQGRGAGRAGRAGRSLLHHPGQKSASGRERAQGLRLGSPQSCPRHSLQGVHSRAEMDGVG